MDTEKLTIATNHVLNLLASCTAAQASGLADALLCLGRIEAAEAKMKRMDENFKTFSETLESTMKKIDADEKAKVEKPAAAPEKPAQ